MWSIDALHSHRLVGSLQGVLGTTVSAACRDKLHTLGTACNMLSASVDHTQRGCESC